MISDVERPLLQFEDDGYIWQVPLRVIADHRAKYYAGVDKDTSYQAEYDFIMRDPDEGVEWYENNMNWEHLGSAPVLVKIPEQKTKPSYNAQCEVYE